MPEVGWRPLPAEGRGPRLQQVQGVAQGQAELWGLPASLPSQDRADAEGFEAALLEAERAWALCWAGCSSASSRTPVSCSPREAGSEFRSWDG